MKVIDYIKGIKKNNRTVLAKAITLIESSLKNDKRKAVRLIDECLKLKKTAIRIGISGTPGVGKSTFIESLGVHLSKKKHKVAVLAIDPSSTISKGSILGDKTRMNKLANRDNAFIRPSPSKGDLGGITISTKDSITLCEAAGYNIILIETVGVGQSETMVESITDFFVYLTLIQNGDEIQFIKKGVLELIDIIIINKADQNKSKASELQFLLKNHLEIANTKKEQNVFISSALKNFNIENIWMHIEKQYKKRVDSGEIEKKRNHQNVVWFKNIIQQEFVELFKQNLKIKKLMLDFEKNPTKNPTKKALDIISKFKADFQ